MNVLYPQLITLFLFFPLGVRVRSISVTADPWPTTGGVLGGLQALGSPSARTACGRALALGLGFDGVLAALPEPLFIDASGPSSSSSGPSSEEYLTLVRLSLFLVPRRGFLGVPQDMPCRQ